MPNMAVLNRFAEIKIEITKLEQEQDMLKEQVFTEVETTLEADKIEKMDLSQFPGYSFSLAKARPKWEYTANVRIQDEALKQLKKVEEQTGKATNLSEGKRELRFNQPKTE